MVNNLRRTRGRPKASEAAVRVEKLLEIATDVFLECGYSQAKMLDIAIRAGASKSSLYALYPTKQKLFIEVISKRIALLNEQMDESLSADEELPVILQHFSDSLVITLMQDDLKALFNIILAEKVNFPELAEHFWQSGPGKRVENLSACLASHPQFIGNEPYRAAEIFVSACWGVFLVKSLLIKTFTVCPEDIATHTREVVAVFISLYCKK